MRLAFSTLGVPGLTPPEVVRLARDTGFDGVELRAHPEEPVYPGLNERRRAAVAREFTAGGIRVLTVSGYPRVARAGADAPVLAEIRDLVGLARDLGAPYVRVFPGAGRTPAAEDAPSAADAPSAEDAPSDAHSADAPGAAADPGAADAARRLTAAAPYAARLGVRILLETHDSHRTGAAVARAVPPAARRGAGALRDVLHTWLGGEDPGTTLEHLAPLLGHVQVKDVASAANTTPLARPRRTTRAVSPPRA